ncbi:MAG TPA: AbrB/MazE/SpoVT family DNA-binding domain-containing protein [Urbifossiella sp.]|nr:AbrB/MazE/SpoVT family DNA-binding domain-containing protein [Urbifossiella sp.]
MFNHSDLPSRVRVDSAGRIVIPAEFRSRFHIDPGDELLVSPGPDALEVRTFRQVVRQAQAAFAPYRVPGHSVVDELLRDRREEAAREYDL